ncbi:EamA family transporter [Roseateles sp. GG27B]
MTRNKDAWIGAMPALFVAIWCTGFVVARLGMPHAPPITFLAIRFALSVLCFGLWAKLSGAAWPTEPAQWGHLAVLGFSTHAIYLICGWAAVKHGLGAGTMALIAGLQPLLTALWLHTTHDRSQAPLRRLQWAG